MAGRLGFRLLMQTLVGGPVWDKYQFHFSQIYLNTTLSSDSRPDCLAVKISKGVSLFLRWVIGIKVKLFCAGIFWLSPLALLVNRLSIDQRIGELADFLHLLFD